MGVIALKSIATFTPYDTDVIPTLTVTSYPTVRIQDTLSLFRTVQWSRMVQVVDDIAPKWCNAAQTHDFAGVLACALGGAHRTHSRVRMRA
jgi:hypothetical protein